MDLKEPKWKLLEWQEIRKLFPAVGRIKELGGKLRKWTDFSSQCGKREKMGMNQKPMRPCEDL